MSDVMDFIIAHLPPDTRSKSGGEYEMNCHSCGRVEKTGKNDTRHRGGMRTSSTGFTYHCFNCGYKCGYTVGQYMSNKAKQLFIDMGWDEGMMTKLKELVFKNVSDEVKDNLKPSSLWKPKPMPVGYVKIIDSLKAGKQNTKLQAIVNYMTTRNSEMLLWTDFYWNHMLTPQFAFKCHENGKEVGYISRNISSTGPKYYKQIPPNYMYNLDIGFTRKVNVITEGALDAIAINGIGLLGNSVSTEKRDKIKNLMQRSKVIYVPDKDKAGLNAVSDFMKYGLNDIYISCPDWDAGIKDPFDAVNKYGRIYTLEKIINSASSLMIGYMKAVNWCVENTKSSDEEHYNRGMLPL